MRSILIIEHAKGRANGLVKEANKYRIPYQIWKPYEDEELLEEITEFSGLIVGGGPMGVYETEKYTFFKVEMGLIENAFQHATPTFGVCLGAQLIAQMLGSKIEKTFWRWGFMFVKPTEESVKDPMYTGIKYPFPTFQFHQDEVLDLPPDSILTLTSDNCTIEGFRLLKYPVWGIQAHPEIGLEKALAILSSVSGLTSEDLISMLSRGQVPNVEMNSRLFENFFKLLPKE
ncbi:MAG: Glutamine amidotransferase class-I [Candidatus Woesebacteria bacterium GW2011_GWB1_38_5b]|uniref:Glutamine amidotransferase class-I n=1 Tax=Candidatus Woesebacteria bacterium GW2011_GWB1_38_5b TaxID=1618569 RepID=A0A0G0NBD4_9BACT|nr:MAG: Glutamine amidotransferase class-I [Candidatus Woesebacteria bacterium GW2011_GWB1_38_5b]